jgi:hypothetical protein
MMSDLRDRLVRRSERFYLPSDALQRLLVRGSRIRRRRRIAATVVALMIGVAGTLLVVPIVRGVDTNIPTTRTSSTPKALPTIPDGVYWTRPLTRADLVQTMTIAGFTHPEAKRNYFDHLSISFDQWIRMGLVIQEGFWFQTARADTGEQEAGWSGSFQVTGPHTVQASGYGCTITYRFSYSDGVLTLHVVRETGDSPECAPGDLVPQAAIFNSAPFVRESIP